MPQVPRRSPTRRGFVRMLGGAAGVAVAPTNLGCGTGGAWSRGSTHIPSPAAPFTPTGDFYVNWNFGLPEIPRRWRLHVDGLVRDPLVLSLDALQDFEEVTRQVTLECIGNSPGGQLISAGAFTGVRLRDVLAEAGMSDRARGLQFVGLDGYPAFVPADVGRDPAAILAHSLNDAPLPLFHGAPLRVLVPGRYGMFSIKWLDAITPTRDYAVYGSMEALGTFVTGSTGVRSRVDTLRDGQVVVVGEPITFTGIAVTAGTGIARVQVDTGAGWNDARQTWNTLADPRGDWLWTLWRATWTPVRTGPQEVRVRAFDHTGAGQSAEAAFPYDATAIHVVAVHARS